MKPKSTDCETCQIEICCAIVDVEEAGNQAIGDCQQLAIGRKQTLGEWMSEKCGHTFERQRAKAVQCMKAKNGLCAKSGQAKQSKLQSTHCIGAQAAQAG